MKTKSEELEPEDPVVTQTRKKLAHLLAIGAVRFARRRWREELELSGELAEDGGGDQLGINTAASAPR